eukprot:CAMPEP_0184024370 /NCGR_PEP_ID=MMETSP0954-20121128/12038_1 /TAXON_ID=627963 /ORGANISM="Aplanochytrium sp, Strain PBS07" /LENGTH=223 /DNA_ID=CAMNT_0026307677 /DNA_START=214 /DNA_END=885 /DNA_ORIENTATION=-
MDLKEIEKESPTTEFPLDTIVPDNASETSELTVKLQQSLETVTLKSKSVHWKTPLLDIKYVTVTTYSEERLRAAAFREKALPKNQRRALVGTKSSKKRNKWTKKLAKPSKDDIEEHQRRRSEELELKNKNLRDTDSCETSLLKLRINILHQKSGKKCFLVVKPGQSNLVAHVVKLAKTKLRLKGKNYALYADPKRANVLSNDSKDFGNLIKNGCTLYLAQAAK